MQFSSKSIAILVFGNRRTESDFQIRIRVCDYLASTMAMIEQDELKEPGVARLADAKVIGVARSTSGLSRLILIYFQLNFAKKDFASNCPCRITAIGDAQW